ncbi:hypothetical protein HDU82_004732 [Entophlyctis luteolus]|nr:hypothetical protein HDU82_004732 [Entophlyctis luteolus]
MESPALQPKKRGRKPKAPQDAPAHSVDSTALAPDSSALADATHSPAPAAPTDLPATPTARGRGRGRGRGARGDGVNSPAPTRGRGRGRGTPIAGPRDGVMTVEADASNPSDAFDTELGAPTTPESTRGRGRGRGRGRVRATPSKTRQISLDATEQGDTNFQSEETSETPIAKSGKQTPRRPKIYEKWQMQLFPSPAFAPDLVQKEHERKGTGPDTISLDSSPIYVSVRPKLRHFTPVPKNDAVEKFFSQCPKDRKIVNSLYVSTEQEEITIPLFTAKSMIPGNRKRKKFVMNFGPSVWGLDWARIPDSDQQFLAIGGYASPKENHLLGARQVLEGPNDLSLNCCIQLWRLDESGKTCPTMELCLLTTHGVIYGLEWASARFYETAAEFDSKFNLNLVEEDDLPRLGLLAVSFGDGSCRVINVPHPSALKQKLHLPLNEPAFGSIGVWDVNETLRLHERKMLDKLLPLDTPPAIAFTGHSTAVSQIEWGDQTTQYGEFQLFSSGFDGEMLLHDIRNPWASEQLFKMRGVLTCISMFPQLNGYCLADTENTVRYFRPGWDGGDSKDADEETHFKGKQVVSHLASVWDIDVSQFYAFVASVGADGCLKMSNLNRTINKTNRPVQVNLYQLGYDAGKDTFTYIEDLPEERVKFNCNKNAMKWVASGGLAGLVRVETAFEGRD